MLARFANVIFTWLAEYAIDSSKVKIIFQCEDDDTEIRLKSALQQELGRVQWYGDGNQKPLFSELKNIKINGIAMYFPGKF